VPSAVWKPTVTGWKMRPPSRTEKRAVTAPLVGSLSVTSVMRMSGSMSGGGGGKMKAAPTDGSARFIARPASSNASAARRQGKARTPRRLVQRMRVSLLRDDATTVRCRGDDAAGTVDSPCQDARRAALNTTATGASRGGSGGARRPFQQSRPAPAVQEATFSLFNG
jgi:hypothetical protein